MSNIYYYFDDDGKKCVVDSKCVSQHSDGRYYDDDDHECQRELDGYVEGTAGNDLIDYNYTGDPEGDRIDHNDAVLGTRGSNNDIVYAYGGNDTVLAGEAHDTVFGGDGNDLLNGGNGNDKLYGDAGHDTLTGGAGCNESFGGAGDDRFVGGAGADTFFGGAGQDNLDYSASCAAVVVNLGTGVLSGGDAANDRIGDGIDGAYGSAFGDSLTGFDQQGTTPSDTYTNQFYGNGGNDTITGAGGNDLLFGGADNDSIIGGAGNDTIGGDGGKDSLFGGDGSDSASGGAGNDVIDTSGGGSSPLPDLGYPGLYPSDSDPLNDLDTVYGGDGNDTVTTGDDADLVYGGVGNDSINGGFDKDTIFGDQGDDTIIGGEGSDSIDAGDGADLVYGGLGPNFPDSVNIPDANGDLVPNNGADSIRGGLGNDTIYGLDDDDTIDGGQDNDFIDAGVDDDLVTGGSGNDTITGGQGGDTLSGGNDRDVFIGGGAGDVVDGNEGGNDFDTLDLTGAGPLRVVYDPANAENGTVRFLDSNGAVTGTLTFSNIENVIPCFTPGTLIATPRGEVPVENLRIGDRVITRDNGLQEIRWIGARSLDWRDLNAAPHLKPVLVRQGSLGNGLPERDMLVSPNHRLLVANDRTALYFDEHEVLVAAKHLIAGQGVHLIDSVGTTYIHFMFDRHEVVLSNGAWTESFQPGDLTLKGMGNAQRSEIFELFPELKTDAGLENYGAARRTLKRHEAALLVR